MCEGSRFSRVWNPDYWHWRTDAKSYSVLTERMLCAFPVASFLSTRSTASAPDMSWNWLRIADAVKSMRMFS